MAGESERQELDEKEDLISDLPDSIIHHILSLFPSTDEAIRTGILSKRWQNQWTQVPVLVFCKDGEKHEEDGVEYDEAFSQSIDSSLRLYRSSKIKKLHLCYNFRGDANFISKIRFANIKYVEELILEFDGFAEVDDLYLLPECIFENASLVKLQTYKCAFPLSLRINWPSLKVLKIKFFTSTDSQVIERVVSSCLSLEYLKLENSFWEIAIIASKSLKRLTLRDIEIGQLTKILCPNLEKLSMNDVRMEDMDPVAILIANVLSGTPLLHSFKLTFCFFDQLVIASKSLKKLVLSDIDASCAIEISCPNIEELKLDWLNIEKMKLMNLTSSTCVTLGSPYRFLAECEENLVSRILEQFQQVKELRVNKWFVQVLSIFEFGGLSYPLLNIKCLTLDRLPLEHIWGVVNALRCSPALERLVINEFDDYNGDLNNFEEAYKNSNGIDFTCLMLHLKTVKIIGLSERDVECKVLPFVEFLLKNTRTLEKMVVKLSGGMSKPQAKVLAKLLSFPRCSPQAILELL